MVLGGGARGTLENWAIAGPPSLFAQLFQNPELQDKWTSFWKNSSSLSSPEPMPLSSPHHSPNINPSQQELPQLPLVTKAMLLTFVLALHSGHIFVGDLEHYLHIITTHSSLLLYC